MAHFLIGPSGLVDDGRRRLGVIAPGHQVLLQLGQQPGREENGHGGAVGCQRADALPLGHRRAARRPGDDHRLADAGQGVFRLKGRRRPAKAGDAGHHLKGDVLLAQRVHLLPDGPIDGGVAGVQPDHVLPVEVGIGHHFHHFFQCHLGAVVDLAAVFGIGEHLRVDQAACIDDHIGLPQQPGAPHGDQVGGAAARPYDIDHGSTPLQRWW